MSKKYIAPEFCIVNTLASAQFLNFSVETDIVADDSWLLGGGENGAVTDEWGELISEETIPGEASTVEEYYV